MPQVNYSHIYLVGSYEKQNAEFMQILAQCSKAVHNADFKKTLPYVGQ